jgi:hypothetical protein
MSKEESLQSQQQPSNEPVLQLDENAFDIYIRMKQSPDNDLCFQITETNTFRDLFEIFKTVPIVFSPSILYDKIPIGFSVSNYPGFLTRTGTVLFGDKSSEKKYLTKITNLDDKIANHCLPGQLIVPIWKERVFLHQTIISFFLVWLYTDLPDFISPTPGICLTNYLSDGIIYLLREVLKKPDRAQLFYDDIYAPVGVTGQCIYFAFHIFKIALLYFIIWSGAINPYSFKKPSLEKLTREKLLAIGWTGVKKVQKLGFQDEYRKFMVVQHGSIMNLYTAGKLAYIKECFVELEQGEGYDSIAHDDLNVEIPFKLSKELLLDERQFLNKKLSDMSYEDAYKELKRYRSSGPLIACPELKSMTDAKFFKINKEIAEKEKENNPIVTALNNNRNQTKDN